MNGALTAQTKIGRFAAGLLFAALVAATAHAGAATPSANGKIAFLRVSSRDDTEEIYLMNADGSGQRNLSNNRFNDGHPAWSPDGRMIAFVSDRHLMSLSADCANLRPFRFCLEVYVMNADGSGKKRLTKNLAVDGDPAWSPNGRTIAFDRSTLAGDIYLMNPDGSGLRRLTRGTANDVIPAWSPDGKRIVFVSDRDGNGEIYVMNADGSGQRNLTRNRAVDLYPAWSPDGKRIAFASARDDPAGRCATSITACNLEIYVMNADGSGQQRLTRDPTADWQPAWSPDGSKIGFASYRDGNSEIYVMNATDGSGQTRLTRNPTDDAVPAWQPVAARK